MQTQQLQPGKPVPRHVLSSGWDLDDLFTYCDGKLIPDQAEANRLTEKYLSDQK